ncbi:MAG: hypothetical protein KJ970_05065 [Candidatus Eisenbacteria bacterium]|uniref:Uncharacterized protein n=1 Tax=Eiseniibacteriota bacterium TaxID=2212470 RepID=A0A948W5D0_UNCEI|nr:hypothetical protein [Candidatus Eisenbacteria bacterium]MBU1947782.1 hypothetical protein [Candidatus Eisenbacteria bacterium]MBU2690279.1 hypothetical protein [Candidatus Eisenbacteria bacterium]
MRESPRWMQVWTRLKRKDPILISALQSVVLDLGWGEKILGMELWTLWELNWAGTGDPSEILLQETTVLANPNREKAWIRSEGAGGAPPGTRPGSWQWCLAWDREQPRAGHAFRVCERLLDRCGMKCHELIRAQVWGLNWGGTVIDPRRATLDVAMTRSRREGLLINPHVHAHQIFSESIPFPWWIRHEETGATL